MDLWFPLKKKQIQMLLSPYLYLVFSRFDHCPKPNALNEKQNCQMSKCRNEKWQQRQHEKTTKYANLKHTRVCLNLESFAQLFYIHIWFKASGTQNASMIVSLLKIHYNICANFSLCAVCVCVFCSFQFQVWLWVSDQLIYIFHSCINLNVV